MITVEKRGWRRQPNNQMHQTKLLQSKTVYEFSRKDVPNFMCYQKETLSMESYSWKRSQGPIQPCAQCRIHCRLLSSLSEVLQQRPTEGSLPSGNSSFPAGQSVGSPSSKRRGPIPPLFPCLSDVRRHLLQAKHGPLLSSFLRGFPFPPSFCPCCFRLWCPDADSGSSFLRSQPLSR